MGEHLLASEGAAARHAVPEGADEELLRTADGVQLAALRWPPRGRFRASVVLVHGFASSSRDPAIIRLGSVLARSGLEVLTYDGRGHGRSAGRSTLVDLERLDVAAAVARCRPPVVVVGVSMGAIAVLRAAGDPVGTGIDGVVAVSSPARWRLRPGVAGLVLVTRTALGAWLLQRILHVRIDPHFDVPEPPLSVVGRIAVPVAFLHGSRDRIFSSVEARLLHARGGGPRHLEVVTGMGHGLAPGSGTAVVTALEWVLSELPPGAPEPPRPA
ncbi:MAG: alpha/beta hydrolase [Acidimicrobiales bacterium]